MLFPLSSSFLPVPFSFFFFLFFPFLFHGKFSLIFAWRSEFAWKIQANRDAIIIHEKNGYLFNAFSRLPLPGVDYNGPDHLINIYEFNSRLSIGAIANMLTTEFVQRDGERNW